MKNNHRSGRAGFTLIELLAVITIIVILAGLVVGGMGYVNEKQARSKAQTQLALLSKGIEAYKLDMGDYPTTKTVGNATDPINNSAMILYAKLFYEGADYIKTPSRTDAPGDQPRATQIYVADLDPRTSRQGWMATSSAADAPVPKDGTLAGNTRILDPWGNEYRYRPAKKFDGSVLSNTINPDFDLWSVGKDGKTQGGSASSQISHKDNLDDIRNF